MTRRTIRPVADESLRALGLHVWAPIVIAAPALAFPFVRPLASIALIVAALVWCVLSAMYGPHPALTWRSVRSPLVLPVLVVVCLAAVGTTLSDYPEWSVPKLASLLLGVLIGRATLLTATTPARLWGLAVVYAAFGLAVVAVAAVAGPQWRGLGSGYFQNLAGNVVPSLVTIPGAEAGPNTNAIGGTTLFFLSFSVALIVQWPRAASAQLRGAHVLGRVRDVVVTRAPWLIMFAVLAFVLLISQSRTSWLSALVATGLVLALRFRGVRFVAAGVGVAMAAVALWFGPVAAIEEQLRRLSPYIGFFDNSDRPVIWRFAIEAIRTHPWLGVGFGAFRESIHTMTMDGATYALPVPHAHNIFLQVLLDLGVAGLVAYVAILAIATRLTWRVCHSAVEGWLSAVALGLWSALVAIHLFGLLDCIALGAKVGIFFWMHLALIGAIDQFASRQSLRTPPGA